MVCPYCGTETGVKNSRHQKRNNQIWRRRYCPSCKAVFTTHEVIDLPSVFVVENGNSHQPYDPALLVTELLACLKDRKDVFRAAQELSALITQNIIKNASGGLILAHDITHETAKVLKSFDRQAYLRYLAEHPSLN